MPSKTKAKMKAPLDPNTPLNKLGNPKGGRPKGSQTRKSVMIATKSQRFIKNVFANAAVQNEQQLKWATIAASLTVKPRSVMPMLDISVVSGESPKEFAIRICESMIRGETAPDVAAQAINVITSTANMIDIQELEAAVDAILKDRDNLSLIVDNTAEQEPLSATRTVKPTHRQVSV